MAHLLAWGVKYPRIPARLSAAPHPSLCDVYGGLNRLSEKAPVCQAARHHSAIGKQEAGSDAGYVSVFRPGVATLSLWL